MKKLKLSTCRRKEHCGEHRVNKQRRRADETETFPITSYKVEGNSQETEASFFLSLATGPPSESSSRTADVEHVEHVRTV
jgi:hypothetical protein